MQAREDLCGGPRPLLSPAPFTKVITLSASPLIPSNPAGTIVNCGPKNGNFHTMPPTCPIPMTTQHKPLLVRSHPQMDGMVLARLKQTSALNQYLFERWGRGVDVSNTCRPLFGFGGTEDRYSHFPENVEIFFRNGCGGPLKAFGKRKTSLKFRSQRGHEVGGTRRAAALLKACS